MGVGNSITCFIYRLFVHVDYANTCCVEFRNRFNANAWLNEMD